MRRLDLHPLKKLRNPARHLRALETWSRSFTAFFPTPEMAHEGLWTARIPVFQKVVAPARTTPELQSRCAQLMIDAAARLRDARPGGRESAGVYAFLTFPDMFGSFVEVAFEANRHLFFDQEKGAGRPGNEEVWHEYFDVAPGRLPALNLRIPTGFEVLGTGLRSFDQSWMSEPLETEEWAVGEVRRD